jgi:hypothetical protein
MRLSVRAAIVATVATVALLFVTAPVAQAQGVGIGAKIGPLFSSLSSDAVTEPLETKTGWIGGLFIGGNRPGRVGVGVDILYARKKVGTGDGDTATFDYLSVPVLLRINGGSQSRSGVNVFGVVGPAFDVKLKSKFSSGEDVDDQVAGFDLGLAVGAGVEITRFLIEGRYMQGLRSIEKDLTGSDKIKTKSFAIMLGVRFN